MWTPAGRAASVAGAVARATSAVDQPTEVPALHWRSDRFGHQLLEPASAVHPGDRSDGGDGGDAPAFHFPRRMSGPHPGRRWGMSEPEESQEKTSKTDAVLLKGLLKDLKDLKAGEDLDRPKGQRRPSRKRDGPDKKA
jgi:hypothetical protein